ncbi:MAG: hypothetical protein ABR543_18630 [Gemmatimonadaceae bacterium]
MSRGAERAHHSRWTYRQRSAPSELGRIDTEPAERQLKRFSLRGHLGGCRGKLLGSGRVPLGGLIYSVIILRELRQDDITSPVGRSSSRGRRARRAARNILYEFGPAAVLDSTIVRPLAMGLATTYLRREWGVPLGKVWEVTRGPCSYKT